MTSSATSPRDVVLVGGGHSHVQVLRRFAAEPLIGARLTVVVDAPVAVYSGMVPGFVAGQYSSRELELDVVPLASRAQARVVMGRAVGIDTAGQRILVEGHEPIGYDVASIDIGSVVAGLERPGVRDHAVPTRPIGRFVSAVDDALERLAAKWEEGRVGAAGSEGTAPVEVVVVGGGTGGVELAFTMEHRLRRSASHDGPRILPTAVPGWSAHAARLAAARGIAIRLEVTVTGAREGAVSLAEGRDVPFDLLLWVTGAVSQPLFRESGLPVDDRGFVLVRSTLQVEDHDNLFATGDCATLIEHRETPKAGVYAVREGPFLIDNLRAFVAGRGLRRYTPQRDFLSLMNLGDGTALGSKWGLSVHGRWVMRLKDRIDRRFVRQYQC